MNKDIVDNPPEISPLQDDSSQKLTRWINFFRKLSERITVITQEDKNFEGTLCKARNLVHSLKYIDPNSGQYIADWPENNRVAFIILVDSANLGQKPLYEAKNIRIFCYRNLAFGLNYFGWDGDHQEECDCKSHSLGGFPESALS